MNLEPKVHLFFGFSAIFLIHCKDREYLFTVFAYYLYCLLALGTMENKKLGKVVGGKRGADEMEIHVDQMQDRVKLNESEDQFAYVERYEMKELLSGIMSIQQTLANFMIRLDHQGNTLDSLKKDIHGQNGIENRLQLVQEQANDVTYDVTELTENQRKMQREVDRMRDYIIRLEQKIHSQNEKINELSSKSMESNIIISGVQDSRDENLALVLNSVFKKELELTETQMNEIRISKFYRMGQFSEKQKSPRPILVQFSDSTHKDAIMRAVYKLKEKKSPIRISQQLPEAKREHRIRLYEVQSAYAKKNITSVIKRDRLIFSNGTAYRDKTGGRPQAAEILVPDEDTKDFACGDIVEDNGNRFEARAVEINTHRDVKKSVTNLLRLPNVSSATHNVYAYRFVNQDGVVQEGSEDDDEYGAGRALLRMLRDNNTTNAMVLVSRWYASKIGSKRFVHYGNTGLSAVNRLGK